MQITISAELVAWYAAIVATGSLAIGGINAWRDSRRLKVTARPNMRDLDSEQEVILIEVSNVGRRAVSLQTLPFFKLKSRSGGLVVKGDWQPKHRLLEGESAWMRANQDSLQVTISELSCIVVRDETGAEWTGKITV